MKNNLLNAYVKVKSGIYRLIHEEKGASDILALIIIIGIVLTLAIIFRKALISLVSNLWNTFVSGSGDKPDPTATVDVSNPF